MRSTEEIIKSIEQADECEIMEFDFSECFAMLRAYDNQEQSIAELEAEFEKLIDVASDLAYYPSGSSKYKTALAELARINDNA